MTKVEKEFCDTVINELIYSTACGLGDAFKRVFNQIKTEKDTGCPVNNLDLKKAVGKCAYSSCRNFECCIRAYGDYVAHQVAMHMEPRMEACNDNREDS